MRIRTILLAAALIASATVGARAEHNACNPDPKCNYGVGSIQGHVCVRSEVNTVSGDHGNGRVCTEDPTDASTYLYARGLTNREPVIVCRDFEQIFPEPDPNAPDFCAPAH